MRINQGGSVVSFLVVGAIFVLIVIGAVYAVQHRSGNNASSSQSPVVTTSKAPVASSHVPTPSSSSSASHGSTPAPTSQASPNQGASSTGSPAGGTNGSSSAVMPQTGPSDMMPSAAIVAVLVGVAVAFAQSVKARRRLSL